MRPRSGAQLAAPLSALALLAACASTPPAHAPPPILPTQSPGRVSSPIPNPPPAEPRPSERALIPLHELYGWAEEDHVAALKAFQAGCGAARSPSWRAVCQRAREQTVSDEAGARAFFEDNFKAEREAATGLLTAYFAPEYPAQETPDEIFTAPVLPKPDDIAMVDPGPDDPPGRKTCRRTIADSLQAPCPDRAAIEAEPSGRALAFMKPEDLFFLQIQGSGQLVFPDGHRVKAVYAADNGRPFVGIARPMAEEGILPANRTSGDAIRAWLADHRGAEAVRVMDKNPRYVFFNLIGDDGRDPAGAAGVALPPGRSIAIDPSYHAYGELYWLDAEAPVLTGGARNYRRLAVALDTGSAIRGDERADLYMGRGEEAGSEAGHVRHVLSLTRLIPLAGGSASAGGRNEKTPQG